MFLLVNRIEVDVFVSKEEACLSDLEFLACVGRCRTRHTRLVLVPVGDVEHTAVTVLRSQAPQSLVCWCCCQGLLLWGGVPPFRTNGEMARRVWGHLDHLCRDPHGSAHIHLTSLQRCTSRL